MSDQFSGVKDVSEHLKFDLTHLNTYLEENLASIGRVLDYKQLKAGNLIQHTYWRQRKGNLF